MNLVNYFGPGVAVLAVKQVVTTNTMTAKYAEAASYLAAGLGYYAAVKGKYGEFAANFGIAAVPWAAENLWNRVKGIAGISGGASRVALRQSAPSVARNYQPEFANVNHF